MTKIDKICLARCYAEEDQAIMGSTLEIDVLGLANTKRVPYRREMLNKLSPPNVVVFSADLNPALKYLMFTLGP